MGWLCRMGGVLRGQAVAGRRLGLNRSHGCVPFSNTGHSDEIIAPPKQSLRALVARRSRRCVCVCLAQQLFTTIFSIRQMQACGEPSLCSPGRFRTGRFRACSSTAATRRYGCFGARGDAVERVFEPCLRVDAVELGCQWQSASPVHPIRPRTRRQWNLPPDSRMRASRVIHVVSATPWRRAK